jgi:hypothetical protein
VTGGGGVVAGGFAGGALDGKLDAIARSLRTLQDVLVHRLPFVTAPAIPAIPAAGYSYSYGYSSAPGAPEGSARGVLSQPLCYYYLNLYAPN